IPFKVAGEHQRMPEIVAAAPENLQFLGHVGREHMGEFYKHARAVVLCSTCFEGLPMAVIESMLHCKPVIAFRIGALPEIVRDGKTGLLFSVGDAAELAERIAYLWKSPNVCEEMGRAARTLGEAEYSPHRYYERLLAVYNKAINLQQSPSDEEDDGTSKS
ncbi:MAG: glycosyltransferase family 4 protein, partial [Rhodopirellula sp.]|nr:glycosyltransferase family 4 protein [Rhodopirellula sp.]